MSIIIFLRRVITLFLNAKRFQMRYYYGIIFSFSEFYSKFKFSNHVLKPLKTIENRYFENKPPLGKSGRQSKRLTSHRVLI